jgi:sterol desaturase/sphingolipid hydroxylase (fatty acid hydroxylase superfamily)
METPEFLEAIAPFKLALPVVLLIGFYFWETWRPFFIWNGDRLRHAVRNLSVALLNTAVLAAVFAAATIFVAEWTTQQGIGLLNVLGLSGPLKFIGALLLLDAWMYVWHRANHTIPVLWRFHRMHHSDTHMDVTTATRFHLGEHIAAQILRLGLIPLLGLAVWPIVVFEMLLVASTQFHHSNISVGKWDRWLRMVFVTPDMHKVHHSRLQPETDSNYSTVLSVWDRIARSFRIRQDPRTIEYGLDEFRGDESQTIWGMLRTPFLTTPRTADRPTSSDEQFDPQQPPVKQPS